MSNASARRGAFALGAVALVAAFATGSSAFAVAGVGFLLAVALTWLWTWFTDRPVKVALTVHPPAPTEGDRARIDVQVERGSRILSGSISARTTIGRLGARSSALRADGRRATGEIDLGEVSRGVYAVSDTEVLLGTSSVSYRLAPPPSATPRRSRFGHVWSHSTGSSATPGVWAEPGAACSCGGLPASTSTRSASTSRASRSAGCTGRRARVAASSW